jgi:hypothetical protein
MLVAVLQGCISQEAVVRDRFRAEYGCDGVVRWLAGTSYRARGCGHLAIYTCVTPNNGVVEQICVRERGDEPGSSPTPSAAQQQAWARSAQARVDRHYDEAQQAQVVQGDFTPAVGVTLQLLGAPKLELGDIAVHVVLPKSLARTPCDSIALLVNGVPTPPAMVTPVDEGYRVRLIAHFDFQQFKPLAQRFPAFGVRRCGSDLRLTDADVAQLQKFLAIYSDMAVELQSAQEAGAPAGEPLPKGSLSL